MAPSIKYLEVRKMVAHVKKMGCLIGIVLLAGGFLVGSVGSAELKIGSVDIQKAVNECNTGKEAKKDIAKEVEKFQRLIADKQKELQTLKETLEKQAAMLNADARAAKEKEFQAKTRDFQRWGQDYEADLNQKRAEKERAIFQSLQKVIQKLGADEGYTLILEKNEAIVLYASKVIDLTDRVIKLHDSQKK
jgi:outer membrane protein